MKKHQRLTSICCRHAGCHGATSSTCSGKWDLCRSRDVCACVLLVMKALLQLCLHFNELRMEFWINILPIRNRLGARHRMHSLHAAEMCLDAVKLCHWPLVRSSGLWPKGTALLTLHEKRVCGHVCAGVDMHVAKDGAIRLGVEHRGPQRRAEVRTVPKHEGWRAVRTHRTGAHSAIRAH